MRNALFYGSGVALVTPFSGGKIDLRAFEALIHWHDRHADRRHHRSGHHGRTVHHHRPGARGADRMPPFPPWRGRVPLIVGAGANDTRTAVAYAEEAQALGADGLLVVTPYYNKASRTGLIEHYHSVADRVEIPIIAYNVPSRTGLNLPAEVVRNCSSTR